MISMTMSNMAGLGVAAVGQEHVVDSRIDGGDLVGDGGDLVGEVTPSRFHETP